MTEGSFPEEKKAGEIIDDDSYEDYDNKRFSMSIHIPISHVDIHNFIKEKCSENLFLIKQNNEAFEALEKRKNGNND